MAKSKKIERMHIFVKAYDKYRGIEDMNDLRKNDITLAEYRVIYEVLSWLSRINGDIYVTFMKGVADWFKKNDFYVEYDGVNYRISI